MHACTHVFFQVAEYVCMDVRMFVRKYLPMVYALGGLVFLREMHVCMRVRTDFGMHALWCMHARVYMHVRMCMHTGACVCACSCSCMRCGACMALHMIYVGWVGGSAAIEYCSD